MTYVINYYHEQGSVSKYLETACLTLQLAGLFVQKVVDFEDTWRRSSSGDRSLKQVKAQKSLNLPQNGFAWLSGLIPEQRHRDGFRFTKTEPWPVNGTAFTMFGDFNLNG